MKGTMLLLSAAAGVAVCVLFAAPAQADSRNELTYLTFSQPVELPGVVLPAGTYMFRKPDSPTDQDVVQVFSKDGDTSYGTFLTIPDRRPTPTD
jgi:hypothetical protein